MVRIGKLISWRLVQSGRILMIAAKSRGAAYDTDPTALIKSKLAL
jgi:hypothetical protein